MGGDSKKIENARSISKQSSSQRFSAGILKDAGMEPMDFVDGDLSPLEEMSDLQMHRTIRVKDKLQSPVVDLDKLWTLRGVQFLHSERNDIRQFMEKRTKSATPKDGGSGVNETEVGRTSTTTLELKDVENFVAEEFSKAVNKTLRLIEVQ